MEKEIVYVYMYPVIDITESDTQYQEISWINPQEISHVESNKRSPVIYANGRKYRPLLTVGGFEDAWAKFGLFKCDGGNAVNLNQAEFYDDKRGYMYLKGDDNRSKGIPVAKINESVIKNVMDRYGIQFLEPKKDKKKASSTKLTFGC